jgi:hypothetical protein
MDPYKQNDYFKKAPTILIKFQQFMETKLKLHMWYLPEENGKHL